MKDKIIKAELLCFQNKFQLLQLWYHESCRVFQDRLVCVEDRDWFSSLLNDCIQEFECSFEEVVSCQPVLYGDFMVTGADHKVYTLIDDKEKASGVNQALVHIQCIVHFIVLRSPVPFIILN